MVLPIIRVEDWEEQPPLATKYVCGDNELDFETVYTKFKYLPSHSGRGYLGLIPSLDGSNSRLQLKECDPEFLDEFWDCAAILLDYFADFLAYDSVTMQSVWFYLLDLLQEAGSLPHQYWQSHAPSCRHAYEFAQYYEQLLELINVVITSHESPLVDTLVIPRMNVTGAGAKGSSGFKSGLKLWQQFLYNNSPGFGVPVADQVYSQGSRQTLEGAASEQYVPAGALAIVEKHTKRLKNLTARYAQSRTGSRSEEELLSEFDQHNLRLGSTFAYTSIDGRETLVQPLRPNPLSLIAPRRRPGLGDPSMIERCPDLSLLDECVGNCKGSASFVHPDGDGFHMWQVSSAGSNNLAAQNIDVAEYSSMYDEFEKGA